MNSEILNFLENLKSRGHREAIYHLCHSVPKLYPENLVALDWAARNLFEMKRDLSKAADLTLKILEKIPFDENAKLNAARCLNLSCRADEAEILVREYLDKHPSSLDAQLELSLYLSMQGKVEESYTILVKMHNMFPSDLRVLNSLGWHYFRQGQSKKGLECLSLSRQGKYKEIPIAGNIWRGENLEYKTLLIVNEGGRGDEILMSRFASYLAKQNVKVILCCHESLVSLLSRIEGISAVMEMAMVNSIAFDYWVLSMDLPVYCCTDVDSLPTEPYISPQTSYLEKWEKIFQNKNRLKVGLRWQGNSRFEHELMRSPPIENILELTETPGISFYSLQKDEASIYSRFYPEMEDLSPLLTSWEDTAAAISSLDLVITTCTSVAHLAGALGKPVWVIVPLMPYFIWAYPGEISPWYKSMILFRQQRYREWEEPMAVIHRSLEEKRDEK